VAVVDEAFVARHLPDGSPIGRRVRFGNETADWLTVVGVVPTLSTRADRPPESVYTAMMQAPVSAPLILAWTAGEPLALTPAIRSAVLDVNDQSPVGRPNSLAGELWQQGWPFRVFGGLFLTFGFAALVLAAAGLYGVMSFSVRRRTQEIGVRMALGADRRSVLKMVLWQGLWWVGLGVVVGLVPGWYVGTLMGALLANVDAADPLVLGLTAGTLTTAGLLASLAPALRAASVDPLTALRRD
jgi:putative ABC transport system permease protein